MNDDVNIAAGATWKIRVANTPASAAASSPGGSSAPGGFVPGNSQTSTLPVHDNNTFLYQGSQNSILTLNSSTKFDIDVSGATLSATQPYSFAIGQAGTVSGLVTPITDPTLFTPSSLNNAYTISVTTLGNIVYLNLVPVPEPAGVLGIAGSLLLLLQRGRRYLSR